MNRVYIKTYGCQMNERDSSAVAQMLRQRGYSIVTNEHDADIVLLNTCSVRDQSEQKAIGKAGYLTKRKKTDPNFILGVLGCMAQNRGADLLDNLPDLDLIVGTQKFHRTPDHLDNLITAMQGQGPIPATIVDLEEEDGSQNTINSHNPSERKISAFVSIMQGCDMNCAFCIVPKTRGTERSRPMEEIINEIRSLTNKGTREITLLGQIVTSYGKGIYPAILGRTPFVQLLEKIHEIPDLDRIRFTSPHPLGFRKDLVNAFRDLPKLGEYAHLPVQSGSDRILKGMNRPYSRDRYLRLVSDLRAVSPNIHLSTDVIVGFPGENDMEFQETLNVMELVRFDSAYTFKYSARPGTKAAEFIDHVGEDEKQNRLEKVIVTQRKHTISNNKNYIGKTELVLVEKESKKSKKKWAGRTDSNKWVIFDKSNVNIGDIIPVFINKIKGITLHGNILSMQEMEAA